MTFFIYPSCYSMVCIISLSISQGYVAGRQNSYNDVTSDWQQCLFEPNYAILPIAEAAEGNPVLELLERLGFPVDPQDKQLSMVTCCEYLVHVFDFELLSIFYVFIDCFLSNDVCINRVILSIL